MQASWTQMRFNTVAKQSRCLLLPKMSNFYTVLITAIRSIIFSFGCNNALEYLL